MKSVFRIAAPLAATFLAAPVAAVAQTAILADNAALRAGPGFEFPRVAYVPENARVNVRGCVRGYDWCDVSWRGERGWIDARNLRYSYNNRYVIIEDWGPRIGLPIVPFVIESYWASHYRDRPWWNQRYTWFDRFDRRGWRDGDRWRDRDGDRWRDRNRDSMRSERREDWRDRQTSGAREEGRRTLQGQRDQTERLQTERSQTERLQRGETRQWRGDQAGQQQREQMGERRQRSQTGATQQREDRVYRQPERAEGARRGETTGRIPEQRMQRGNQ